MLWNNNGRVEFNICLPVNQKRKLCHCYFWDIFGFCRPILTIFFTITIRNDQCNRFYTRCMHRSFLIEMMKNCLNWSTETKDISKIKVAQFFWFTMYIGCSSKVKILSWRQRLAHITDCCTKSDNYSFKQVLTYRIHR